MINIVTFKKLSGGVGTFAKQLAIQIPEARTYHIRKQKLGEEIEYSGLVYQSISYLDLSLEDDYIFLDTPTDAQCWWAFDVMRQFPKKLCVIHDPTSVKEDRGQVVDVCDKFVVIRRANVNLISKSAKFIFHPYTPEFTLEQALEPRELWAISHARLDYTKQTHLMLMANEFIEDPWRRIKIHGKGNRSYIFFKLMKLDPSWEYGQSEFEGSGAELCRTANFDVDLSRLPGDGGHGTQYTFLEASDAGAVPIVWHEWVSGVPGDIEAMENVIPVEGAKELADVLEYRHERPLNIVRNNRALLERHKNVGAQFKAYLEE